jgi:hypothetical protein
VSTPAPIQQPCSVSPQPLPLSRTHRPTVAWAGPRRSQGGGAHDADRQRESMSCEKQWVVANDKRWANQLGALRPRPPQMMVTPQPFSHSPVGAAGATVGAGALCGPTGRGDQRDFFAAFDHWRAPIPAPSIVSTPAPIQQPCSVSPQPLGVCMSTLLGIGAALDMMHFDGREVARSSKRCARSRRCRVF